MNYPVCAIATPVGRAAVGIIRISGEGCLSILQKIFHAKNSRDIHDHPRLALYGEFVCDHRVIDDIILIPFPGNNSYTGEESAEIHCHGNPIILKKIISALNTNGIAMASPGEFTRRAFLNGKMDLTAAQAVHDIISARNEFMLQSAQRVRKGEFRKKLYELRSRLMNFSADLSAELDFLDEDITFAVKEEKALTIQQLQNEIQALLQDSEKLKIYREGFMVAIVGAPNTGKSTLLNYISGYERAIVSEIPGTTRDFLDSQINLMGIDVIFTDTAGIRPDISDEIEREGVRRSLKKAAEADMLVCLIDGSVPKEKAIEESPLNHEEFKTIECPKLIVINKSDSLHSSHDNSPGEYLKISLKTGNSGQKILDHVQKILGKNLPDRAGISLSLWQREILNNMHDALAQAQTLLQEGELPEIITECVNQALSGIGKLTGEISSEDILGRIFSRFCIGK